jgi:hypothetical protein
MMYVKDAAIHTHTHTHTHIFHAVMDQPGSVFISTKNCNCSSQRRMTYSQRNNYTSEYRRSCGPRVWEVSVINLMKLLVSQQPKTRHFNRQEPARAKWLLQRICILRWRNTARHESSIACVRVCTRNYKCRGTANRMGPDVFGSACLTNKLLSLHTEHISMAFQYYAAAYCDSRKTRFRYSW